MANAMPNAGRQSSQPTVRCTSQTSSPVAARLKYDNLSLSPSVLCADIEEITHKTGHFRQFSAFVQMLRASLGSPDGGGMDCVLDILTYADLQALKSGRRPAPNSARPTADAASSGNNKRYIILTHTGQERCVQRPKAEAARPLRRCPVPFAHSGGRAPAVFTDCGCRVHYPLPLAPDHSPVVAPAAPSVRAPAAPAANKTSLDDSHEAARPLLRQYDDLLREKACCSPRNHCACRQTRACARSCPALIPPRCVDPFALQRSIAPALPPQEEVQAAYERLQRDSSREIAKVRRRSDELAQQLDAQAEQMEVLQSELMARGGDSRAVERLRAKLQRVEQQSAEDIDVLQRTLGKHKKEVILLNSELSRSKREEERLRRHVRQLEAELKMMQRRAAASGGRDTGRPSARPSSASTPASRSGSTASSRAGSRPPSAGPARAPYAARPTASSRASSAASSTASSRAGSVERGNASRTSSRPTSRAPSADGSRPASREASRVASRVTSADRSRPTSRASSNDGSRPPSRDSSRSRPGAPPSLERAAREALLQTTSRRAVGQPASKVPSATSKGGNVAAAAAPRPAAQKRGLARRAPDAQAAARSDGARFEEWDAGSRHRGTAAPVPAHYEDSHKENQGTRRVAHERPSLSKGYAEDEEQYSRASPTTPQYDATDDIQDIDRRLNALQQFLEAAKAPR